VKLAFDTNVVLDVLLDRKPYVEAASRLFALVDNGRIDGSIYATTATTICSIATKSFGRKRAHAQVHQQFEDLGGNITASPAAIAWGTDDLDIFVRGDDGALWHIGRHQGDTGSLWESLGGSVIGRPAVIATLEGSVEVYTQGADHALLRWVGASSWAGPTSLGGILTSEPAVVDLSNDSSRVYVRGPDGQLWVTSGAGWTPLGGALSSAPAALYQPSMGFDLVWAGGPDYALWITRSIPGDPWDSEGGSVQGKPAVAYQYVKFPGAGGAEHFEIFTRSLSDHLLYWRYYIPATVGGDISAQDLGGTVLDDPSVVTFEDGSIDVYVRGPENRLWHRAYHPLSGWSDWIALGGFIQGAPSAVRSGSSRVDIFARSLEDHLLHWWEEP
jgi:hypothetical protein